MATMLLKTHLAQTIPASRLTRVSSQSKTKYAIPNAVFKSDWDLVEAIVQTYRCAGRWVQGYFCICERPSRFYSPKGRLRFNVPQLNLKADKHDGNYRVAKMDPIVPLSH
jgi:hypothetical protein